MLLPPQEGSSNQTSAADLVEGKIYPSVVSNRLDLDLSYETLNTCENFPAYICPHEGSWYAW